MGDTGVFGLQVITTGTFSITIISVMHHFGAVKLWFDIADFIEYLRHTYFFHDKNSNSLLMRNVSFCVWSKA